MRSFPALCFGVLFLTLPSLACAQSWPLRKMANADSENIRLLENGNQVDELPRLWFRQTVSIVDDLSAEFALSAPELILVKGHSPNAFVTHDSGGRTVMAVNTALLRLASGNPDYLATVIGHELGHLKADHLRAGANNRAILGILAAIVGAVVDIKAARRGVDSAGVGRAAADLGAGLVLSKFSRDQERQADDLGVRAMAARGYNPMAAGRFWERMQAAGASGSGTWWASHPAPEERAQTLSQLALSLRPSEAAPVYANVSPNPATAGAAKVNPTEPAPGITIAALVRPAHSVPFLDGAGWACVPGFRRSGNACEPEPGVLTTGATTSPAPPVPLHAVPFIDRPGWSCIPGYRRVNDRCEPEEVQTASAGLCEAGQKYEAGQCVTPVVPKNARLDANGDWACIEGYVDYQGRMCVPMIVR